VISSPAKYRHVQQEVIAEIHRTSIWTIVVIADGNIRIPENSYFVGRDGGYVILIPDGDIKNFLVPFNELAAQCFGFTRLWNSETKFIVAEANEFSMSQQKKIIDYFSKLRIYNCIIITQ